ncbi:MFS transporter [Propioniciclava soli]|uniref:NarK/NasA family nitrate transporter n=1 Tax=Propioniciclava soli TaxID=2775081 RepID=A0ABZ3C6L1_9ACTN|nr:nitrate/nitrite transporter [Propioniciclava soli]
MTSTASRSTATTTLDHGLRRNPGRWIDGWDPENRDQWEGVGRPMARRNLYWSIFAEFLGFAVWALWSIVVPRLNTVGFDLSVDQMFWLVSTPALVGATLRIPYTFAVPTFGGRTWTMVSALLLLIPTGALAWAVHHPELPFGALVAIAALAGFGGGNFASSMANISFFFPAREKGAALGLNAAGGNIGTAAVQFAVPIVVVIGGGMALDRAGLMFIPLALLAAFGAWKYMDNLSHAKADPRAYAAALKHPHTWIIAFIYIGTFGSFIGYSGSFPTLLVNLFPQVTLSLAFLGALVGSVTRPLGGSLSDRWGGGIVTVISFGAMALGAVGAIFGLQQQSFVLFFCSFLWLFVFTGIGNGSIYRMIPAVFAGTAGTQTDALLHASRSAAGCIGIAGAIGAFGGFLIPRGFAMSTTATGGIQAALWVLIGAYVLMGVLTWAVYLRPGSKLAALKV